MVKNVIQKVRFRTSPQRLYQIYMDPKKHAAAVGARVSLQPREGGRFSAFGMLRGNFLRLVKNKMIIQTWRSRGWKKKDKDSLLVLTFRRVKGGTLLHLSHIGVPPHDYAAIRKGWRQYYWERWRKYLALKAS